MSNIQFALPTISNEEMDVKNQHALVINQCAAVIVSSYLNNIDKIAEPFMSSTAETGGLSSGGGKPAPSEMGFDSAEHRNAAFNTILMTPDNLESLINRVQKALKQI